MKSRSAENVGSVDTLIDDGYQRMLAARAEIRRIFFSDEAWANPYPLDAPEVIGIHSPDVMRAEFRQRAVG